MRLELVCVPVDSRKEPEFALEILKLAAMSCPAILEEPEPSVTAIKFKDDQVSYNSSSRNRTARSFIADKEYLPPGTVMTKKTE